MSEQNYFADLNKDPVVANLKLIKAKLAATIIRLIREKNWTQTAAAKHLKISQPRVSNLFNGYLSNFSIDFLLEVLGKLGYISTVYCNPSDLESPLSFELKKAEL